MFSTQPTYSIIPCLPSLFILVNFILCGSKRGYSIVLLEANVSAIFDLRLAKAVFAVAVLVIIPFAPRNLSNRAYGLAFMGFACSSLYSVYSLYGKPRAWNLQAVQVWFQSVIATKDFIYFIYCLTFVASRLYLKFALLPILCWALEHVAKFLRRNFSRSSLYRKYLEEPCVWIESNTTTISILSSQAEIGLGFLLILSLFSSLLKLMYHAPVTGGYHQSVWAKIGRTVNPPIHRYAPFLNTPISAVQRWWFR
ncbi:hypothetical protein TEA_019419 [Camellia sinensis var. sinensis]|uniref:Uncharacterized protein n=1 Tax=Camellia sinensis var. sinensis TaxID=542762 RepID=A0A4S4DS76_CAMSN|nr:hypothetical protein TEA_019419 [Camellia sinensis var. sinensis]